MIPVSSALTITPGRQQHYKSLPIWLFNVIYRTFVWWGLQICGTGPTDSAVIFLGAPMIIESTDHQELVAIQSSKVPWAEKLLTNLTILLLFGKVLKLNFLQYLAWILVVWISKTKLDDFYHLGFSVYCLHLYCYLQNVLAEMALFRFLANSGTYSKLREPTRNYVFLLR